MPEERASLFYAELLQFIHADTEKRTREGGYDLVRDPQFFAYRELLTRSLSPQGSEDPVAMEDILRSYRYLFDERGPVHIEKKLLEAFSPQEFALKIYRGLPRVYRKENPAVSQIKRHFTHLPSLKELCLEKYVLKLYASNQTSCRGRVCIFNWVISDGWGDWIAASEIADLLQSSFPELEIARVSLIPKRMEKGLPLKKTALSEIVVPYEEECSVHSLPEEVLHSLKAADVVLSFPTFYPQTELLLKRLMAKSPPLRFINIGEYGYLESSWFHPQSGRRSMGLHFLEKGVLIRSPGEASFSHLENERLKRALFQTATPSLSDIERYLDRNAFYLAYLSTPIGGAVYLHSLLQSRTQDPKPIDICTPDISWLIAYIEMQQKEGKPFLQAHFGVREIEIEFHGGVHRILCNESGKKVRIISPGVLSNTDFRLLIKMSEEFVGIRGNQSFSEAVSANRLFFYDGPVHARYFVKDLIALAENHLRFFKSAATVFRCIGKAFLHTLGSQEGEWVDETFFQEKEPWVEIASTLGSVLQDPQAIKGCKKLNQIIAKEHAFSQFIIPLVRRELIHCKEPEFERLEKEQIAFFSEGRQTIAESLAFIQSALLQKRA